MRICQYLYIIAGLLIVLGEWQMASIPLILVFLIYIMNIDSPD